MAFNSGSIYDAENRLRQNFLELSRLWMAVKDDWLDDKARRFEDEHLAPLGPSLARLSAEFSDFKDAINKADRALADVDRATDGLN